MSTLERNPQILPLALAALLAAGGCRDLLWVEDATKAPLQLHALRAKVPTDGETSLLVVRDGTCGVAASCTVCLSLQPPDGGAGSGQLIDYSTPGLPGASLVVLPPPGQQQTPVLYRAPSRPTIQVVSALGYAGATSCPPSNNPGAIAFAQATIEVTQGASEAEKPKDEGNAADAGMDGGMESDAGGGQ